MTAKKWQIEKLQSNLEHYIEDRAIYQGTAKWLHEQEECGERSELYHLVRQEIKRLDARIAKCEQRIEALQN